MTQPLDPTTTITLDVDTAVTALRMVSAFQECFTWTNTRPAAYEKVLVALAPETLQAIQDDCEAAGYPAAADLHEFEFINATQRLAGDTCQEIFNALFAAGVEL